MKKSLLVGFFSFIVLTLFSISAKAEIRFVPDSLICPSTSQGKPVNCGSFVLKNNNILLSIRVQNINIGDTENFTLDANKCTGKTLNAGDSCSVKVTFNAFEGGGFYTNTVASYTYVGFSKVRNVSAMVYGLATYPIVRLSSNSIAFGDQTIGTSQRQYVKMENIGTGTLNISNITIPLGSGFTVEDDCGNVLNAENYCGILIYFEPTQEIEYSATLDIVDDAYNSPQQIRLSGKGIGSGSADINIDKKYINFGEKSLNTKNTDIITITSVGEVNLEIDSIVSSGAPFTQTNNCPAELSKDETCKITVTFEPSVTGSYSGTLTVTDNATDTPQTIYISGKGVSPNATLTPALVDFGNQTVGKSSLFQEVVLLNSGTSRLTISEIKTSSSLYTQTNTCGASLDPKKICKILVQFSPTATGISAETLTVATNDPSSPSKVYLFGRGTTGPDVDIAPVMFDFGDTAVGATSEQKDFIVKNTGEGDLNISAITTNSYFEQENECPEVLVEEQTCVVETTFIPEAGGSFSGILSIFDDAEGSPHKATLIGFGTTSDITILPASINFGHQTVDKPSLTHEIRLLNSGNDTLTISSIKSSDSAYTQTNDCGKTLAPSAFCTINVIFTPEVAEYITGQILITDSVAGSPHKVSLTGTGLDPEYPDLDIAPNFWDFGQVLVGEESVIKEFTVKNTGLVDVEIYGIDVNSEFAIQEHNCPESPAKLASGEECIISGKFVPEATGQFSGYITVNDNTYTRYQSAMLKGIASHSGDIDISFSATSLNFGEIEPMSESDVQSVILTNAGTDDVIIGSVKIIGSEAFNYSMNTNCSNRSLDVGKSCIMNVVFKPMSSGIKTADIAVYDDAHDSPQAISLSGAGTGTSGCLLTRQNNNLSLTFWLIVIFSGMCLFRRKKFVDRD